MNDTFSIIANWKEQRPFQEAIAWSQRNFTELKILAKEVELVICPDFTALSSLSNIFKGSGIVVGAQHCSSALRGPFTGEVSALSLSQSGCSFCIIGHSEQQRINPKSSQAVAQAIVALWDQNITPILCLGNNLQEATGDMHDLARSLKDQFEALAQSMADTHGGKKIYLVYEPAYAIGSGILPGAENITAAFNLFFEYGNTYIPSCKLRMIYGGSVSESTVHELKNVANLQGFLVGSASLDMQELKKIVYSLRN